MDEAAGGGTKAMKAGVTQANSRMLSQSSNAYGLLFELGQEEELRRTLMVKVREDLKLPNGLAEGLVSPVIDEIVSEREWGWHLAFSPDRLRALMFRRDEGFLPLLCAECVLPGCCYFDVVRLTSNDVKRLSRRLNLSRTKFLAQHCTPYVDASDRCYARKLKNAKPCEFLSEGRCRFYADRPKVCAEFPFVVDATGYITEIRLFPFCNVAFNAVRFEVARRVRLVCGSNFFEKM